MKGDISTLACLPKMVLFAISGLDNDADEAAGGSSEDNMEDEN